MRQLASRMRSERGEGLIAGLIVLAGVLVPLMFIVPLFGRIETSRLAVQQAAREAVRSATLAPDAAQARSAARQAAATARSQTGVPLRLTLSGRFARGGTLTANTSTSVPLGTIAGLGTIGTIDVRGQASAPVGQYRSLLPAEGERP
jgi:hypothetical protein